MNTPIKTNILGNIDPLHKNISTIPINTEKEVEELREVEATRKDVFLKEITQGLAQEMEHQLLVDIRGMALTLT